MSEYTTVRRFMSLAEASSAQGLLEAAGLSARTLDEYVAGLAWLYIPALNGVRVQVPAEQLQEAEQLLREGVEPGTHRSAEDEAYFRKAFRRRRNFGLVALFFAAPWLALVGLALSRVKRRDGSDEATLS